MSIIVKILTATIPDLGGHHAYAIDRKWRTLMERVVCVDARVKYGQESGATVVESAMPDPLNSFFLSAIHRGHSHPEKFARFCFGNDLLRDDCEPPC